VFFFSDEAGREDACVVLCIAIVVGEIVCSLGNEVCISNRGRDGKKKGTRD